MDMDPRYIRAAELIVEGKLTQGQIAADVGVHHNTIFGADGWRTKKEFADLVSDFARATIRASQNRARGYAQSVVAKLIEILERPIDFKNVTTKTFPDGSSETTVRHLSRANEITAAARELREGWIAEQTRYHMDIDPSGGSGVLLLMPDSGRTDFADRQPNGREEILRAIRGDRVTEDLIPTNGDDGGSHGDPGQDET